MRKEQIIARTERIYSACLEMSGNVGKMSQKVATLFISKVGGVGEDLKERELILSLTVLAKKISTLVLDNVEGKARIKDLKETEREYKRISKIYKEVMNDEEIPAYNRSAE